LNLQGPTGTRPAIILQRFWPRGFGIVGDEGDVSDFKSLGGGKESHVQGIVIKGINQTTLFNNEVIEARFFSLDTTCQPDRPTPNNDQVIPLHSIVIYHSTILNIPEHCKPPALKGDP
jgi:hypothetical protein